MRKRDELADPKSCLNKAKDDELIFVFLERDKALPNTLRAWVAERIKLGLNEPGDAQLTSALRDAVLIERARVERLVKAAVELAVVRHDLGNCDGELGETARKEVADDIWGALRGIGTCDGGIARELLAVLNDTGGLQS